MPRPCLRGLRPLLALWLLAAPGPGAQSSARPVPTLARPPLVAWSLAEAGASGDSYPGSATPEGPQAVRPEIGERPGFAELDFLLSAQGRVGLKGAPGDVALQRGSWTGAVGAPAGEDERTVLSLLLRAEWTFYELRDAGALFGGNPDPLNDVYETSVGFSSVRSTRPGGPPEWFVGFELGLAGEDGADVSDALVVGGVAGLRYTAHPDLSLSMGVAGRSRLDDDPFVIPYVGFDWQATESLELVAEGSRVSLMARLTDDLDLALRSAFEMRQFRLNADGPLAGGVLQDDQVQVTAGLEWRPSRGSTLRLEGGGVIWRELNVLDSGGATTASLETETGPLLLLSATFDL